jgi:hypothetical protein
MTASRVSRILLLPMPSTLNRPSESASHQAIGFPKFSDPFRNRHPFVTHRCKRLLHRTQSDQKDLVKTDLP